MEDLIRDTRYGLRLLARSPIFTATAVLSLALGIGANAAIFHLIDSLTLRSLAIVKPHELVEVRPDGPQAYGTYDGANAKATYPLWEQIRANQSAFSATFAWGDAEFVVGRGAEARLAGGLWVSGDFFPVLGIPPYRGRLFGPADDRRGCGAGPAVVSHAFWQSHLGGRESAIGTTLTLRDQPFTVVGVTPPSFTGLEVGQTFDIALPLCAAALWDSRIDRRDRWWLTIMGRLGPEWTIARANEHLRALSPGVLDVTIPPDYDAGLIAGYRGIRFGVVSSARGVSRLRETHGTSLAVLMGLTALVLLITCNNLATLVLARASAREREMAVRVAIGASRRRLVSQMLIENLLLAAAGALFAVPLALLCGRALVSFLETSTNSIHLNLTADWRLASFVGAAAALTVLLFGLLPALRVSSIDPIVAMRHASRGLTLDRRRARLQRALVVGQIAISLVLIFSALLFVQTFRNLAAVDAGFEQDRTIAVLFLDPTSEELPDEQKVAFQEELTRAIRSLPGVAAAASSTHVPLSGSMWSHFFRVTSAERSARRASRFAYVGPGYFETLRIPLRSGRDFQEFDTARSHRVMVVNESFVRSHLAGRNPLGTIVRTLAEPGFPETSYEIVGVVGDTKYADLRDENCWCDTAGGAMAPIAYVPIAQNPSPYAWAAVMVRSELPVGAMRTPIARRVEQLNPSIATHVMELKARVRERLVGERVVAWLAGAFGVLATVLVVAGLYGIIAYLVVSRRKEIGVRLSLGATRAQIVRLVLRDNLWLLGVGLATGLPLAVGVMKSAGALLFGLTPMDVPTVVAATCLLALAGLLAGTVPAWRAAQLRPEVALRCE
jgi:putative ABC transport system permease protein